MYGQFLVLYFSLIPGIPDLNTVAHIESNNNPRAVSRCGALGVCQIMPSTWRLHARQGERWSNPIHNRRVASRYFTWIKSTLKKWGDPGWNNPSHILASYNGGIGRFRRCGFNINRMPRETQNYVAKYHRVMNGR
jgi:soluble lytic murein transglycosylase-like protein